jgi:signal peptidase I
MGIFLRGGSRRREDRAAIPRTGVVRQTVELLVALCLCVLLGWNFAAEPYVVPTGSMAPTLLGLHSELICPSCSFPYVVGIEEDGHSAQAVCPNCGERGTDPAAPGDSGGDRVLVQKLVYEFRRPRRWEVAVFHFPGDPVQAYVKRVVGLPGEAVRISGGDVYVSGRIARKNPAEQRAMRILVHDSGFCARGAAKTPRWSSRSDREDRACASGWSRQDASFRHEPVDAGTLPRDDWLVYHHLDPVRGRFGPVTDFYAYNGAAIGGENEVNDLGLEARVTLSDSVQSLLVALQSGKDRFTVRIPVGRQGAIELNQNGEAISLANCVNPLTGNRSWPRSVALDAWVFDRRVCVSLDGKLMFDPVDYEREGHRGVAAGESPVALGVRGGAATVTGLRVYRDVYYTGNLANTPLQSHDRKAPVQLGPDDYFVLGDNSPVSNDSRFWSDGPIVPGSMLVGKPFLVHLPGKAVLLKVFGRSVCWVPDPRRIRYIR